MSEQQIGSQNGKDKATEINGDGGPKKLKPCCACPETKKVRDQW